MERIMARVPPGARLATRDWMRDDRYEDRMGRYGR